MPAISVPNIAPNVTRGNAPVMSLARSRTIRTARTPDERVIRMPSRPRGGAGEPNPPAPDPAGGDSSLLGVVDTPLDWATEAGRALKLIGDFFTQIFKPAFWLRNFIVIGGIVAIVGGFIAFMRG